MLRELRIRNLAIIDDLVVRFERGLNVLTGETGAGKSIIVDALGLALGDRAQSDLIKSGEKEAVVQAYFELEDYGQLPDIGVEISEGLVLRRVISSGGKSKAYVNDMMVTLQTLSEVGKSLVDIHSQHEHQSLLATEKQLTLLDSYGKLQSEREKLSVLFHEVKALKDDCSGLRERGKERAHRLDLLRFQINEIDAASLKQGEKSALEEERKIQANVTRLNNLAETAYSLLYGSEGSADERLSRAVAQLKEMHPIDSSIGGPLEMLESAKALIEDASFTLRGYRDKYDFEPGCLEIIEDRLELIGRLEKKYGDGVEAVMSYRDAAEEELKRLESADDRLASLEEELRTKEQELLNAAAKLSEKRKKTARELERRIIHTLSELAFAKAEFRIDMAQERAGDDGRYRVNSSGMDRIEFQFSANPGEPLKSLAKIISGGELSRVMLALKSILADVDSVPVLIFDEVDAGIGGRTAESVGRKLDMISATHQLICITHLPQIASFGDVHLKIEKEEKNNKVHVEIKELYGKERQDEIARMLSGKITEISLKHAGELLERSE
jgi:DNA repair protein RecN (Recombination protein N)